MLDTCWKPTILHVALRCIPPPNWNAKAKPRDDVAYGVGFIGPAFCLLCDPIPTERSILRPNMSSKPKKADNRSVRQGVRCNVLAVNINTRFRFVSRSLPQVVHLGFLPRFFRAFFDYVGSEGCPAVHVIFASWCLLWFVPEPYNSITIPGINLLGSLILFAC